MCATRWQTPHGRRKCSRRRHGLGGDWAHGKSSPRLLAAVWARSGKAIRADDAYRKDVAIKLIRDGRQRPDVVARFLAERQIPASLDHPNIARLLDGGTTEEGLPYFVMEYVDGEPITRYAQTHALSLEQRLTLFESVCGRCSSRINDWWCIAI